MQKSSNNQQVTKTHRQVQSSTTLNRKYVRRPQKTAVTTTRAVRKSPQIQRFAQLVAKTNQQQRMVDAVQPHPVQTKVAQRTQVRAGMTSSSVSPRPTAKQLKDQAIQKALAAASLPSKESAVADDDKQLQKTKHHFGIGRVVLALSCAAAAVFAIVYFVNLNMPDISLKVAAIQTGIEATYPSYIPRDFSLSGIVSENGKISLNFSNGSTGETYTITEENSSWDSNALLMNYVKEVYGDNYTVVRERGLTIYISGSNASWANGGIVYKLTADSGVLTKKQISSIATSL